MKCYALLLFCCLLFTSGHGQADWTHKRDSLLQSLAHSKEDTNRVWTLERLSELYLRNELELTLVYADTFGSLSKKLNFTSGIVSSLNLKAWFFAYRKLKTDTAITLELEASRLAKKANLIKMLPRTYNILANLYEERKEDYSTALSYYLKSLAIFDQTRDTFSIALEFCNVALAYISLKEYNKAYQYAQQGLTLYHVIHVEQHMESGIIALGEALIGLKRYDTAMVVLSKAMATAKQSDDVNFQQELLIQEVNLYTTTRQLAPLKQTASELLTISESLESNAVYQAWGGLSDYYFYKRDLTTASVFNDSLIDQTRLDNALGPLALGYDRKSKIGLARGNLDVYSQNKSLYDSVEALVLSDQILKNTQELEAKYSLDKKQSQIDRLSDQEKINALTLGKRRWTIWALLGVIIVIVAIGGLLYSNTQHKKRLQQQKITELEKEKQLLATRSVLLGQDEERKRLAKDLHDGLGGILSVAKYSFNNMKQNLIISPGTADAFDRSMGFLDKSIQELRRVAHNMMPQALVEFGLDTALKDYCNSITNSGAVHITYHSFDLSNDSLAPTVASVVYRIIQELINNTLKHAQATIAVVQLVKRSDALSITVEDDGKGFDTNILKTVTGIGYLNLQNRVSYLGGTMEVQSAPGKGTFVSIDIENITQ